MGIPKLQLRGFAHMQYEYERADPVDGLVESTNHFTNGGVDLVIFSEITKTIRFHSETVFEFGPDGENVLDVERVELRWSPRDWLNATIGRQHTPIGYWNDHDHHGVWMQTTVDRPIVFRFEDDGGLLPVHMVGLMANGIFEPGAGTFGYDVYVVNRRGRVTDSVQLVEDANDHKAFGGRFRFAPAALPGLDLGAHVYVDKIPSDPGVVGREDQIPETIFGGYFVYLSGPWEVLVEGIGLRHLDRSLETILWSGGGYAQLAYGLGHWRPYYRYAKLVVEEGDPFFTGLPGVEDQDQHTFGIRFDWFTFVALKAEYRYDDARSGTSHAGTAQIAFAF